ncbi:MAG TPA: hypothetical protein VMW27_10570 [Thermoanaerobaculia bacterium]|nr:hypothetical protein [Thermoanaerobaculia bacterium]
MAKRKKASPPRAQPELRPAAPASPRFSIPPVLQIALAALAVLLFYGTLRITAPAPWSYDEYYHLGLAREMRSDFRIDSFHWTPFSIFHDHFADKEPLFHVLLMPFAGLPLERAGLLGVLLGQVFLLAAFGWVLWRLRVPGAFWLVLGLAALGPMFAFRADMCRPHIWLIGFSLLVLGLLAAQVSWKVLVPVCALFGLAHTGGWIAIAYAALWGIVGFLSKYQRERQLDWRPAAAAAGGWLLGQLVHPNVPENFRLFFIQNFVVPYQSTAAGNEALRAQLGNELTRPELPILLDQWPAFIAPALLIGFLFFQPRLRTRATLTASLVALAFLFVGTFYLRRFFELGAPLSLLALGLVLAERREERMPRLLPRAGAVLAALAILIGSWHTGSVVRKQGFGTVSPPREMASWFGKNGRPGERVFTAQWADSAPLFYSAPQLQSLVVLDPTFFYAKDPELFELYARIVQGLESDPASIIRERFGARWVTLWKMPVYYRFAEQLASTPGVLTAYDDPHYLVVDLGS